MPVNLNTQQTVPASQGGAAAHVGAIGEHTVTLSGQPPLRLDKIKGNPLPFQGFRVATRIQSAEKGMQTNVTAALGALTRPGGRLNPKALMGGLKAFHTSLDNFIRLENTPASRVDQVVVEQLSKSVESLSSRDLAATYQTFQSREMTLLKDALQAEARRNPGNTDVKAALAALFDLEAVVLKEVSERMISVMDLVAAKPQTPEQETAQDAALRAGRRERAVEGADAYANDLSPRNVAILVERSAEAHTRAENTLNARTGAMLADRNVGIDARQIGDTLRGSELTMNVDVSFLFGEGGAIKTGVWENIHHISERALAAGEKAPKGPEYIPFRNAVEEHVFPELAGRPARANERPSYAALNVSGDKRGAVPNYGQTAFVLRPEAAQRATYTAIDTFKKIPLQFNAERRDELTRSLNELASLPGMDENTWTQLRDSDSELRRALDEALTHVPDGPLTLTDMEALIVQETGGTENAPAKAIVNMWVRPLLINAFGDADANRSSTATYDTLENLLPQMEDGVDGEGLIHAAASGESRFTLPGRYIEAQLQGTFVPSRDVAEIRIDSGELIDYKNRCINGERLAALRDFTQANGIKLTIQDFYANLAELASGSWERQAWDELRSIPGINVITQSEVLEDTGPKAGEYTLSLAAQEFSNTHQSIGQTKEAARGLIADAQKLDEQLRGLAAELGISTEDGVPLAGEAMNRVKARFVENVERAIAEASAQGKGINSDAVLSEALRSAAERPLRAKAALLAEMELLEFDNPEQKAAFRGWVVSARALSDPREMRLIHANAMAQVARMERLGPHPALADLSREFANGLRNLYQGVDAFKLEANPDDFGPDDLFTEINRVAFMSATLLKAVNPGLAEQMLETLEAPAARELRGVCAALHGSRTEDLVADDKPFAATLGDMMSFTADAFARQLGKPLSAPPSLSGDIDLASGGTRAALAAAAPNIAAELNVRRPVPTALHAFPTAQHPEAMPASQAERRAFHVNMLGAYRGHEETFDGATGVHGMNHASRTFIFATAMSNILAEKGIAVDRNAVLCGISAHDSGRRGNGADIYEEDSAAIGLAAMRNRYGDEAMGEAYEAQFSRQIVHPHGQQAETVEEMLLQSADSLDISRTQEFDPDLWPFLKEPLALDQRTVIRPDSGVREQLVRESVLLQRLSDPAARSLPRRQDLMMGMMNSDNPELVNQQIQELNSGVQQELAELRNSHDNEAYFARIENIIRDNAEQLPLLNKYYFMDAS